MSIPNLAATPPQELIQLAYVSKRYFKDGRTRVQIAEEMGLSRFKVARLIQKALDTGVVKIQIEVPGPIDVDLSLELQEKFQLRTALVVVTAVDTDEQIRSALGQVTADLLSETVREDEVVGLSAGRTLIEMSQQIHAVAHCDVVQLTGVADPLRERGMMAVNRFSALSGGELYSLPAPLVATDDDAAAVMRRQPAMQRTLKRMSAVTKAVVTIGSWPHGSLLHDSLVPSGEAAALIAQGVVAEIGTTLLSAGGKIIDTLDNRTIGMTAAELQAVPEVIAVGGGQHKLSAVRAVLASQLPSTLVTDAATARALLRS
ncbi:sugar-binding transcriptional regulator [Crystallibacter crystallopoietes]|uniref:sugar-binding transcriptional regulator n=1 Tax=Crystallibacter crystallopoietes TaxID=37928 RepID=UPI0012376901|nr:sugar-binding domain-containing protein [Arthrobacter crystallopoietes]